MSATAHDSVEPLRDGISNRVPGAMSSNDEGPGNIGYPFHGGGGILGAYHGGTPGQIVQGPRIG